MKRLKTFLENHKPFFEAIKEMLRVIVIAVIPVLISSLEQGYINWRVIAIIGAIAGLRFIDKILHEEGVKTDNAALTRGLTQF